MQNLLKTFKRQPTQKNLVSCLLNRTTQLHINNFQKPPNTNKQSPQKTNKNKNTNTNNTSPPTDSVIYFIYLSFYFVYCQSIQSPAPLSQAQLLPQHRYQNRWRCKRVSKLPIPLNLSSN